MEQDNFNFIINEKIRFKRYFVRIALFILFLLLLYCSIAYFYIFCFEHPLFDENKQRDILLVFLPTLATIMISVFLISGSENLKEYPPLKRKGILIFVFWMVPNIIFPLLFLVNIIPLSTGLFKFSVVLFVSSLSILIPYVFMFIHASILDVLKGLFNFSALPFIFEIKSIKRQTVEKTNEKVDAMGRLIIRAINEYDDTSLSKGLEKIDLLSKMILESSKLHPELLNNLLNNIIVNYRYIASECIKARFEEYYKGTISKIESLGKILLESSKLQPILLNDSLKNVIVNYRYIASECIKAGLENYLRLTFFNIANLIKYGIACKNKAASRINYPIAVIEMKEASLMSVLNDMHPVIREIIEYLGQIGETSLNHQLDHPPDIEVLNALQEIGSECANRKLENICFETLIRTEFLAIQALNSYESDADVERKKEIEKVYKSALTTHWIVSGFLFKNIPESGEWLKDSRTRMEEVFGDAYGQAYNQALKKMDLTSYVGKKILVDYFEAIRE